jgi:hypothetical protein
MARYQRALQADGAGAAWAIQPFFTMVVFTCSSFWPRFHPMASRTYLRLHRARAVDLLRQRLTQASNSLVGNPG